MYKPKEYLCSRGHQREMSFSTVFSIVTLSLVVVISASTVPTRTKYSELVKDVLVTVEKELNFFTEDYSAINVDGLFGLRLGQGQLRETLRECANHGCDQYVLRKVTEMEEKLDTAANAALPYVETEDPDYYERFIATIEKPYLSEYEVSTFDGKSAEIGHNSNYNEEKGDACYARVMGTYKENGILLPKCNVTKECWDYMRLSDTSKYFATHQLLYFILMEHVGCKEPIEESTGMKLKEVQDNFCARIYEESKRLIRNGRVSAMHKDLFLEQTVLCGPLGYEDFMRPDWIKMVMSWPDKRDGCFKYDMHKEIQEMLNGGASNSKTLPDHTAGSKGKDIMRALYQHSSNLSTMRKLQREKTMKDGCLSHTSGLGFGVLCTYLRFLVRYIPMYMY